MSPRLGSALIALLLSGPVFAADPIVIAPPYQTGDVQIVSPRGLHVATVTNQGSRRVVMLDGKAGAPFDEILPVAAEVQDVIADTGAVLSRNVLTKPVVFSPDGAHIAYAARLDKDDVVMLDDKEIFRAPFSLAAPAVQLVRFSPDGKHVFFLTPTTDTMNSTALVMDGKTQPATQNGAFPVFSADNAHYAYVATAPKGDKTFLVVDGEVASYPGDRPRFTASGKLVTLLHGDGADTVQIDGQPVLKADGVMALFVSPTEDKFAAIATKDHGKSQQLYINDQAVADTDGARSVWFSPDGKHWAARCSNAGSAWMVIDGKKGQTYQGVNAPVFTEDSSKTIYVADNGNKHFVVVNGNEEAGGIYVRVAPKVAGTHYTYVVGDALNTMQVVYDGKATPPGADVMDILLSDDGSTYGYFAKGGLMDYAIHINGAELTGASGGDYRKIYFSPGGKHYATIASPPKGYKTLLIDGQFVPIVKNLQPGEPLFFSGDGEHLFLRRNESNNGAPGFGIYMDGAKVAQFDGYSRNWPATVMWENNADGTISLIGGQPTGNKPGPVVKMMIDPKAAGTTAISFVDSAKAEQAALDKAAADAAAAKAQADADAKAARAKAQADAAAAKAKAKADAAAARAAKKQKAQ